MAVRDGIEIALGGEAASRLAKRLAGRQAARLSLVLEPKTVPSEARSGKGAAVRKAAKTGPSVSGLRRVWYVLQAKRGDDNQMEKVLQAAAEAARRSGISRALELLSTPGAQPHTEPAVEPSVSDYRAHEARRWVEARAAFLAEHESVTAPELARLTGSRSVNPSARAHSWAKANRIFSVNDGTGERYPLFQLREGQPSPALAEILPVLRLKLSNWQIALWFTSPNAWVGGWRRPIDVLAESPDIVIDAARHEVGKQVL